MKTELEGGIDELNAQVVVALHEGFGNAKVGCAMGIKVITCTGIRHSGSW